MPRLSHNDIPIGGDHRIPFIDVTDCKEHAVDLSPLTAPLADFWIALSVYCYAVCCGLNAFTFEPEDIRHASLAMDADALQGGLSKLLTFIEVSKSNVFYSDQLGEHLHRSVITRLSATSMRVSQHPHWPNKALQRTAHGGQRFTVSHVHLAMSRR